MLRFKLLFLSALAVSHVRGHIAYWNHGNYLSPVQSLYVRPSADGSTGDLYVAATEESGVKQWFNEKPVNFLPTAHHQALPAYAAQIPREDIVVSTQKRAVMTAPPVKYSYAYPSVTEGAPTSYPYAIAVTSSKPAEGTNECPEGTAQAYPQYAPFQYYYPQIMAAFAHAMNTMNSKDAGQDGENASKVQTWPSYAYPAFQYVMVDPSAWAQHQQAQAQAQAQAAPTATSSSTESTATSTPSDSGETS